MAECDKLDRRGEETDRKLRQFLADEHPRQLPSIKKKLLYLVDTLARTLRFIYMNSGLRPITDVVPAGQDVEEEDENEDPRKDGDYSCREIVSDNG